MVLTTIWIYPGQEFVSGPKVPPADITAMEDVIGGSERKSFPGFAWESIRDILRNGAEFVLSPIRKAQMQELDELLDHAAAAAESIIAEGVEKAMTKFNRRAQGITKEEE